MTLRCEKSLQGMYFAKLRPQTFNDKRMDMYVLRCRTWKGILFIFVSFFFFFCQSFQQLVELLSLSQHGVFYIFVECIVIVTTYSIVEYQHNVTQWKVPIIYIWRCFRCVPCIFHIFITGCSFVNEAICVRSVGEDQSCFGT